jgi:hypothetical protein
VRRFAIAALLVASVAVVFVGLSFQHPRTRAWWFVLEDKVVWRNPRVTRGLEAALADCTIQVWSSPLPLAAMIVQDKADPCPGDRVPALLQPHLTPTNERILLAYLARHRVSETATKRFVRAELAANEPVSELAWKLLEAPETSPRLRYEIASDVLASDASDRIGALERLPRIHGIGTLVLFESFAAGDASLTPMVIDFLEAPPPIRALEGDPDGVAFRTWIVDRAGSGLGLDREDLAREVDRVHRGLLPRNVPMALYATLRSAPSGTCESVDEPCLRLMAGLLRMVRDDDSEPPPELWPELGDGALTAWIVESATRWITAVPTEEGAARILAAVVHPAHDGAGHDPIATLTWGAGTPGATAALVDELARRAGVTVQLEVASDGGLQIAFPTVAATVPTIGAAERAGALPHPADLARAEALASALALSDLVRAQDVAATFEDPTVAWIASLVGELTARTAPPPPKKKGRKRR